MKLIKILPDRIQIKTNEFEFSGARLNDLISISDPEVELVTMISCITDNDASEPLEYEDYITEQRTVKVLECSILGCIREGKFDSAVDLFPTTHIAARMITEDEFAKMLGPYGHESFLLGQYKNYHCGAWVDGNKFYQRHSCIVGNTGSGKSEAVAKILEETAKNTDCNIVVFDIHGEYSHMSYVDKIEIGNHFSFPIWMLGFQSMCSNILKLKEESATVAMSALRKAYYEQCPEGSENKPCWFNFEEMMKYIKELNEQQIGTGEFYKTGDKAGSEKTVKGEYNGKLAGIVNTMETLVCDRRYQFLFSNKSKDYLCTFINRIMGGEKPVKNIDLSDVPHDIAIIIIGAITNLIYNVQLQQKSETIRPITLVCDEAHVYIPTDFQLSASQRRIVEIFENIAKEGRKFGITLLPATQRPAELNKTIIAQCANFIVMKLNNENDKTMIKGMMPEGSSSVIESTTMFSPGDCLVIGDAVPIPLKIHVDLAKERPQSKTIDFWNEWKKENSGVDYEGYLKKYLDS